MAWFLTLSLFWIAVVAPAEARFRRSTPKWPGHVEVSGKFGSQRDIGRLDFFLPFDQGGNYLLFGDFRGVIASGTTEEGNFGLGYRQIVKGRNWGLGPVIIGAYGFYDIRSSINSFTYHQLTPGIEFLGEHWDLRFNGYAPVSGSNVLSSQVLGISAGSTANSLSLTGTTVVSNGFNRTDTQLVSVARERPLAGWDFEAGYGFDLWREHSLWLYGGYFNFSDSATPTIDGPRLRMEYRIDDIFRVPGARLTLGGEWQDDDVRGSQGFGMVRVRVPLEKIFGKRERRSLRGIERRMIATVIRDIDIVTHAQNPNAAPGSPDGPEIEQQAVETPVSSGTATDPATGQTLNVFFVSEGGTGDCSQTSPCSLATAQANASYGAGDVVVLLSSNGNIQSSVTLTSARQQVVGGGDTGTSTLAFANGGQLSLSGLGTRPTLAPAGTGVTVTESSTVKGFTLQPGGIGIAGSGATGVVLEDLAINGGTAGIQLQGASTVTASGMTLQNTAGPGIQLLNHTGTLAYSGTVANPLGSAVQLDGGTGTLAYTGSVTQTNNAATVEVLNGHSGSATFSSGTLAGSNGSGLQFNNADGTYTFSGTTTLSGGLAGIDITNGSAGTFNFGTGTSIAGRTADAFQVAGGSPTVTYSGTISNTVNNIIQIANTTGGTITFDSAVANALNDTGAGILLNTAAGNVNVANARLWGTTGLDIDAGSGTFVFTSSNIAPTGPTAAVDIAGGTASLTFGGSITQANNAAAVSVSGGHTTGTVLFQNGTISATNGSGLQFSAAGGTYLFNGTTNLAGGDAGIDILSTSTGTFSFGSNTSITSPFGIGFNLAGGSANVTYSGNLTQASNVAAVSISGGHTGTVVFNTGTINATSGTGLQFDNADGTYSFAGTTTLNGGDAGIDILNGSGGDFSFGSGTSITSPTGVGFNIVGGTASVTYSGNLTQANNVAAVSVSGTHNTGTVRFNTGTVSATNGTGLQFDDADGTYLFEGTTTLNGGDAGVDILNGSAGSFTFGSGTSITSPTGIGFNLVGGTASVIYSGNLTQANNVAAVSVSGTHTTGTVRFDTGTISATNGTGLQFNDADGTYQFAGTTTLNGGDAGVDILTGSGGNFVFGTGTTITSPTGTAFNVNASGAVVSFSGSITQNNAARLVDLDGMLTGSDLVFQTGTLTGGAASTGVRINSSAGTVTFNDLNLGTSGARMTSTAVTLSGTNTGTFNFSGLNVFTNTGTAFDAIAGGTVQITGSGNTLDTTGGTVLSLTTNTTIGTAGLTFESITGTGTGNGINLDTTGALGGLTVTGTGAAGSGGTLDGYANGLVGSSVFSVNLTNMNINNSTADALNFTTVSNITLNSLAIAGAVSDGISVTGTINTLTGSGTTMTGTVGTPCNTTGAAFTTNTLTFTDPTPAAATCP